jgi:hypothetical protein
MLVVFCYYTIGVSSIHCQLILMATCRYVNVLLSFPVKLLIFRIVHVLFD